MERHTVVTHGRVAKQELRLDAARRRCHGRQIMSFEQLAVRLAGGLALSVDEDALLEAIRTALPETALGELDGIKELPGVVNAAAHTLRKAWRGGIDLHTRAPGHRRLGSMATLEAAVLRVLPAAMKRPADLAAAALKRLDHSATLFGRIEIVGLTELSPVWRPLLHAIAAQVPVRWIAGPRAVPQWLDRRKIDVEQSASCAPDCLVVSAATAYHEAIEAMRWARQLLASGQAEPADIAIAAAAPTDYDDHFMALRADANLDVHFAHGIKVTASREGQAAAALADILMRGLSQTRMRRLNTLLRAYPGPMQTLPEGWPRIMPPDAPLSSRAAWTRLIEGLTAADWPDGLDHGSALGFIIGLLDQGVAGAEEAGETLLSRGPRAIWRKALRAGAAASLDSTLDTRRQVDKFDPCVSICWMPASELAASPRRFVRLLGLNSSRWPRGSSEDRLLSDHIVPSAELDPQPFAAADRRDFETILATTETQVVLSRARRDEEGRLLGRSSLLLQAGTDETYLPRNAVSAHAFSESDRLVARPQEYRALPQAQTASDCWINWRRPEMTPHDGLVRPDHPVIQIILDRIQSASSLSLLLRNPLGFVWRYGLQWRVPESGEEPLVLDALAMGNLVHQTLQQALESLEADGGLAAAEEDEIAAAVHVAADGVARLWQQKSAVPPPVIWQRTINDVQELSTRALAFREEHLIGARAYGEVAFGGVPPVSGAESPWDAETTVRIPNVGFRIRGYIDRLDISADGQHVSVRDYKTGRAPAEDDIVVNGGRELQRCLYAFAVKAMLGDDVTINASLFYPRAEKNLPLADPDGTLEMVTGYLGIARTSLAAGSAVMGPDTGGDYDDLAFALPANVKATYRNRKAPAAEQCLAHATRVWEEK